MNGTEDNKLTVKDLYKEFWECRNFEIDHLWQRSVFLAVFLLAIAAGYGTFANDHLKEILSCPETTNNNKLSPFIFHGICLALCLLGIIFSQLWIMMAKGSKRWYESYEAAISTFYNNIHYNLFTQETRNLIEKEKISYFGNLEERDIDDSLLSTKGGNFSVSKVNIFIGQITGLVWIVLAGVHVYFLLPQVETPKPWWNYALSVCFASTFSFLTTFLISCFTRSGD
ncbi:MAG: RipA family octameric membrane protein [Treponema sp.]